MRRRPHRSIQAARVTRKSGDNLQESNLISYTQHHLSPFFGFFFNEQDKDLSIRTGTRCLRSGSALQFGEICSAPPALITPSLFAGEGPAFQLYLGTQSQTVSAKRGARRQTLWFKIGHIN